MSIQKTKLTLRTDASSNGKSNKEESQDEHSETNSKELLHQIIVLPLSYQIYNRYHLYSFYARF